MPPAPRLLLAGVGLVILLFTLTWWFTPAGGIVPWGMQVLPLLAILPGLRHQQRRARQWLGFLLLFDLLAGIVQAFSPITILRILGILTTVLALGLFMLVVLTMKSSAKAQPEADQKAEPKPDTKEVPQK